MRKCWCSICRPRTDFVYANDSPIRGEQMKRRTFCATSAAALTATALPVHRLFAAQAEYDPTNLLRLNALKPGA